jgi:hypothetical protein
MISDNWIIVLLLIIILYCITKNQRSNESFQHLRTQTKFSQAIRECQSCKTF